MSLRPFRAALMLALVLGAAPAARAQDHAHHAHKPALDSELAEHFKGIALTDAQVRQVAEIKDKHHKAIDALRKDPGGRDSTALRIEIQKHMDAEHADFLALLTPAQQKVFMENMKSHHAPAKGKPEMDHGAHAGHDMGKAPASASPRKP